MKMNRVGSLSSNSVLLKWLSLVGIIWLQSINGTNSDFPAYSSNLKLLLKISQVELNNLAVASDAGKIFGWISGVAAGILPLWLVLLLGALLGLIGYGFQYLFLVGEIKQLSYWHVFMLNMLAGNSICWINTVCYVGTLQNFAANPRIAISLTTSYVGLSAVMYGAVTDAFFPADSLTGAYPLLNSMVPIGVSILVAPFLSLKSDQMHRTNMDLGFIVMVGIATVTGFYGVVGSLGRVLTPTVFAVGLLALLVVPAMILMVAAFVQVLETKWRAKVFDFNYNDNESTSNIDSEELGVEVVGEKRGEGDDGNINNHINEFGVKEVLKSLDFWLYFLVYMFGATLGLVFLNNLGQIAESRGHYSNNKASSLVSLSSSFGFFGRLMPSIFDYCCSRKKQNIPRTATIAILMMPMVAAFFFLAVSSTTFSLEVGTAVLGVCSGAITSIAVSATSELFGKKSFGVNHNLVVANIPVGSFVFGYFAALIYDKGSDHYHDHGGSCIGSHCYRTTFIIWACFCSLGTLLCLVLFARTRK